MKRATSLLLVIAVGLGGVWWATRRGPEGGVIHDFGEVDASTGELRYDFVLRNDTNVPWRIQEVRAACSCASSQRFGPFDLAPGSSRTMVVRWDIRNEHGDVELPLVISGTGVPSGRRIGRLKARVRAGTWATPLEVALGPMAEHTALRGTIVVYSEHRDADLEFTCDDPSWTLQVGELMEARPGLSVRHVTYEGRVPAAAGPWRVRIAGHGRVSKMLVEVPVHGTATRRATLVVAPSVVAIGAEPVVCTVDASAMTGDHPAPNFAQVPAWLRVTTTATGRNAWRVSLTRRADEPAEAVEVVLSVAHEQVTLLVLPVLG